MDGENPHGDYVELTPAKYAELRQILDVKITKASCEMCGSNAWGLSQSLWSPTRVLVNQATGGMKTDDANIMVMAVIACGGCGNVKFIHTKMVGFSATDGEGAA